LKFGGRRTDSAGNYIGNRKACGPASSQIALERNGCVGDSLDVSLGVQIQVRTANREPDVRDLGIIRRNVQRVYRAGRLVQVRACRVEIRVFEVLPRACERESENFAGMQVLLQRDAGLRTHSSDPKSGLDIRVYDLNLDARHDFDERKIPLRAMRSCGDER